jgi:DNA repair exonuclease SbcCD ATPase subunit
MANTIDFNVSTNAVTVLNQTATAADNTANGFKSAKQELRALQNQLLEMDQTSAEFKKASARAAELKDNISDLGAEINANAGNAFEGLSNNVGLFGSRLMDLDLKGAGQALAGMGVAVSKIDFKTIKEEIGGLIQGLGKLAKAVLANPYLMLAAAIALIVANFDTIIKQFPAIEKGLTGINEEERKMLETQTKRAEVAKKNYENLVASENVLKLQGKTEKEIRDMKIASIEAALKEAKVRLDTQKGQEKAQIDTAKRNRQILEGLIQWINAPLILLLTAVDKIAGAIGQNTNLAQGLTTLVADLLIDPKQQQEELQKSFAEQEKNILDMENTLAGFRLEQQKADKDARDKRKKEADDAAKELKDKNKKDQDEKERLQKEADDKELERRKKLDADMMAEDDHLHAITLEDIQKREKEKRDKKIAEEMQTHAATTSLRAKQSQEEIDELAKAEDAKAQLRVDAMKTSLSIISDLAGAFAGDSERQQKKAFQIQKGVSIATATIDTYLAAQGAYRSQMAITTPDAPVRAAVAAGIAIAQGLARVAIISKQQFQGGGGTGGGSTGGGSLPSAGGTTAPSPANFAFLQNQPNQQPPLQAYVVGTQVSSNLEAQQLIQNQSRLGG